MSSMVRNFLRCVVEDTQLVHVVPSVKALLHKVLLALWRFTAPLRRPLARRLHQQVTAATVAAIQSCPAPFGEQARVNSESADVELLLDSVVRELVRLQMQIELLQESVRESSGTGADDPQHSSGREPMQRSQLGPAPRVEPANPRFTQRIDP